MQTIRIEFGSYNKRKILSFLFRKILKALDRNYNMNYNSSTIKRNIFTLKKTGVLQNFFRGAGHD
jgi:hypothetical protein